jgi:hypothetical protein
MEELCHFSLDVEKKGRAKTKYTSETEEHSIWPRKMLRSSREIIQSQMPTSGRRATIRLGLLSRGTT